MFSQRSLSPLVVAVLAACGTSQTGQQDAARAPSQAARLTFAVSVDGAVASAPLDGRVLVFIAADETGKTAHFSSDPAGVRLNAKMPEPRYLTSDFDNTAQIFGVDAQQLAPGGVAVINSTTLGYPIEQLAALPPGDYWVQGLLHVYETFKRSDGKTVQLPMDRGEGQQWATAPGNLYSEPVKLHLDPASADTVKITLNHKNPPIEPAKDTKYVKHLKLKSELLSKFWGRDMYLGAIVVLPEGYDEHPDARYPLAVYQGHFQLTVNGWRDTPPDPSLPPYNADSVTKYCPNGHEGAWCTKVGYDRVLAEYEYNFYKEWTSPGFPRVLMLTIQHANPYYDDSYAVNSANLGPYGDAINNELIPYVEKKFRGIGAGWARALYGGSTGGWEVLASQVFYPDNYNGAFTSCPDPIDFRGYTTVNLYEDENAYWYDGGPFRRSERPAHRDFMGHVRATTREANLRELVLGTKTRSGGQYDVWEAVFSPVGDDGYPKRIWDKRTGVIDYEVANYWKDHYDLVHIMQRDWAKLGPKLRGKIEIYSGAHDNIYLTNAVYYADDFLSKVKNPPSDAKVTYGVKNEHCFSGDTTASNAFSRLTYHSRFIRKMQEHWLKTAPAGADTTSWRY
ncbi:MAG: alpha/beta hydrolase-fold protein [Gemmatimonadaceae bacterium]